jgi:serine/threonine-protein kinase
LRSRSRKDHRDLKPANVKLTPDGRVKVLDFGLAKALEGDTGTASGSNQLSHSPTMSRHMTEAGMIMGTAAYMSPEQARGRAVDKRADIWSFGVVLFELLAGDRLFAGDTVSDVLAAVLRQEIDWTRLPATTPPRLRELLRRCLEKDVKQRLQAIGEARIALARASDLSDVSAVVASAAPSKVPGSAFRGAWAIAALLLIGWIVTAVSLSRRAPGSPSDLRTSLALPDGLGIPTATYYGSQSLATLALSPRGDQVAFVGWRDGDGGALYLRRFDSFDAVRLTRTEGATAPFFSPDGGRLAFFARGRLWRIDLPGGVPRDLAPAGASSVGGSWGDDGGIVYAPNYAEGLWTVPAEGGTPRPLTKLDSAAGELSHRWPCVLPGGASVLFVIKLSSNETMDDARIAVADVKTGEHRVLVEGGSMPRYLDGGRLVFARGGKLYTVAFDLATRAIRGAPVPVLEDVATGPNNGAAWYDLTRAGMLAYATGGKITMTGRFSWESPGRPPQVLDRLDASTFGPAILSRDARRAVMQVVAANDKLWLIDLEQMNATRLTSGGGNDSAGVLSPDGRFVLFPSDRGGGGYHFYRMPANGSAPPSALMEGTGRIHSVSYPAHMLGFSLGSGQNGLDAYVVALADDGTLAGKPIMVGGGAGDQDGPTVSADAALVAYQSSESGRAEIYVARLADPGARRRVTNDGGFVPRWSRDGKRLLYASPRDNQVFALTLRSAAELRFDPPQAVTASGSGGRIVSFDIAPDGTAVLVGRVADPLMLRHDIRLWPGWGKTLPPLE